MPGNRCKYVSRQVKRERIDKCFRLYNERQRGMRSTSVRELSTTDEYEERRSAQLLLMWQSGGYRGGLCFGLKKRESCP